MRSGFHTDVFRWCSNSKLPVIAKPEGLWQSVFPYHRKRTDCHGPLGLAMTEKIGRPAKKLCQVPINPCRYEVRSDAAIRFPSAALPYFKCHCEARRAVAIRSLFVSILKPEGLTDWNIMFIF